MLKIKINFFIILLFIGLFTYPIIANAQSLSLKLDVNAIQALIKKNFKPTFHLSGPFTVTDLKIVNIRKHIIYGEFDLEFDGSITIPIPFLGSKTIPLITSIPMNLRFSPSIKKGILTIPAKHLVVSMGKVSLSLGSKGVGVIVAFKRWLMSNGGQSLLDKKFKINFNKELNSILGKHKWKISILYGKDFLLLEGKGTKIVSP